MPQTIRRSNTAPAARHANAEDGQASRGRALGNVSIYVGATAFFAAFGAIYEVFSHEVYSYFMIYAFVIPLVAGVIPFLVAARRGWSIPRPLVTQLYGGGVVTLAVSSVMRGVLDIYGTTNVKLVALPLVGLAMVVAALIAGVLDARTQA